MQYEINLAPHFDDLARAITFEIQAIGQIEIEAMMLSYLDGAPSGHWKFDGVGFSVHPVLMMAVLPAFTHGVAGLVGIDDEVLENPVSWTDAGYPSVASALTGLFSETAQKMMVWSGSERDLNGVCPLEILLLSQASGETYDQVKVRSLFRQTGLRAIAAA